MTKVLEHGSTRAAIERYTAAFTKLEYATADAVDGFVRFVETMRSAGVDEREIVVYIETNTATVEQQLSALHQ